MTIKFFTSSKNILHLEHTFATLGCYLTNLYRKEVQPSPSHFVFLVAKKLCLTSYREATEITRLPHSLF